MSALPRLRSIFLVPHNVAMCHKRTTRSAKKYLGAHQLVPGQSDTD